MKIIFMNEKFVLKTKNLIKKIILSFSVLCLVGCSSMNSGFDCKNKPGVNCRSLGEVNEMINTGEIGKEKNKNSKKETPAAKIAGFYNFEQRQNRWEPNTQTKSSKDEPVRVGERVVRIWVAPYQDINDNYHGENIVHTVVSKNSWLAPYSDTSAVPTEITGVDADVK